MKISYQLLKHFIDIPFPPRDLEDIFPKIGHEVEVVETFGVFPMKNVVVGKILTKNQHPDADRLTVCTVDVGEAEPLQIVCGAKNHEEGHHVPVALIGAELPGGFQIKRSKLRGVESQGMMCSAKEIGLTNGADGLLILENQPKVGTPIHEVFPEPDCIYDLSLTANRYDALSHLGIARDLAAYWKTPLKKDAVAPLKIEAHGQNNHLLKGIEILSQNAPYYLTLGIRGVQIGPSPNWLKSALEKLGARSVNNLVDATNYLLFLKGQPLHAFDADKIRDRKLIIREALEGEIIITLDGKNRALDASMLVIADSKAPLVVAGIMGSTVAEVDAQTQNIVLESAYFNPGPLRQTARKLGLTSDSAYRFERGVDPEGILPSLIEAAILIQSLAGGTIEPAIQGLGAMPFGPHTIKTSKEKIQEVLGFKADPEAMKAVYEALGFIVEEAPSGWNITLPTCRREVSGTEDLAEEYIRIAGTEVIPTVRPQLFGNYREDSVAGVLRQKITDSFINQGFVECYHYSLTDATRAAMGSDHAEALAVRNPLSSEQSHLRSTIIPSLLDTLMFNRGKGNAVERLFEVEHTFRVNEGVVEEYLSIGFIMAQDAARRHWKAPAGFDFYQVRSILESIARYFQVECEAKDWQPIQSHNLFQAGHAAVHGTTQAHIAQGGLLSFEALKAWGTEDFVFAGEFSIPFKKLSANATLPTAPVLSEFPATSRDIALLVDQNALAGNVLEEVKQIALSMIAGAFTLENCEIFDIYTGKGIPEGKKSLAISLRFRSHNQTLTDEAVKGYFDKIMEALIAKNYQLRTI
jgi:phenylalanyl-tRNA synthetase beta chain